MNKNKEVLKIEALSLELGETTRDISCPTCKVSGDFSVTRISAGILFKCFRAKCGYSGFVPMEVVHTTKKAPPTPAHPLTCPIRPLSDKEEEFLTSKFHLGTKCIEANGIFWAPDLQRVLYPNYTYEGVRWGYTARAYPELTKLSNPKTILYYDYLPDLKVNFALGPKFEDTKKLLLVEDNVSALVFSPFCKSVALLGHHVPQKLVTKFRNSTIILALDPDVRSKAFEYKEQLEPLCARFHVLTLKKDPKDHSLHELFQIAKKIRELP